MFQRLELEYLFVSIDKNLVTGGTREARLKAFMLDKVARMIEEGDQKQAEQENQDLEPEFEIPERKEK